MRHLLKLALLALFGMFLPGPAQACTDALIDYRLLQPAMQRYFTKLARQSWEGTRPFGRLAGKRVYMNPGFDRLSASQKKHVLSLLLLGYGEYKPLLQLLPSHLRRRVAQGPGAMSPYEVYTADGRVVSLPYNGCARMTVLTEYERSRIGFLGLANRRIQRFPMSRWQQEQVKKLFWQNVGYRLAGDYWISWVPESGHFEIDVPSLNHGKVLQRFWQQAPGYYRFVVVDRGRRLYSRIRGRQPQP